MKLEEYLKRLQEYLRDYLNNAHSNGYVLGLSGGVDSTLVAAICRNALGKMLQNKLASAYTGLRYVCIKNLPIFLTL